MIDHSSERSSVTINLPELDDTNYNDLFAAATGRYDVIKATLTPLTLCNLTNSTAGLVIDSSPGVPPADEHAQRELKLQIRYVDTADNNAAYRLEIPGPAAGVIPSGTDIVPLTNPLLAAFIVAFEANAVSPRGGAVQVVGARIVGRSV